MSHLSHLFPGADEQAVSVRGQSAALHLFFFFLFSPVFSSELAQNDTGGPLLPLCARPLAHNRADRWSAR